ncbi:MAG: hypothetical protein GF401_02415 [Chitinivibrionales bacterium]|nr:hypothetical protein [Chitinivibrionales bacterium]
MAADEHKKSKETSSSSRPKKTEAPSPQRENRPHSPRYDIIQRGEWKVVHIKEDVNSELDYTWLRELTRKLCTQESRKIAFRFDNKTYLFSKLISVLLSCSKIVKKVHGELALVEPQEHVVETLKATRLYKTHIAVYDEEKELGNL